MKNTQYFEQAKLLLKALPIINSESVFALKGGTAINFFLRNLPRISVDIDLTYTLVNDRNTALSDINESLHRISNKIKRVFPNTVIIPKRLHNSDQLQGLILREGDATVKIEPNLVLRGTVYPPENLRLSERAQDLFETSMDIRSLCMEELYAGKVCAALDRQHPRDLFDVHLLLQKEGFSDKIRKAFIVYLISHPRPIFELLNPRFIDLKNTYNNEFIGMTVEEIGLDELIETREKLVSLVNNELKPDEKHFLLSVKEGTPDWNLLGLNGIEQLPAVKWKLVNINKMSRDKRKTALSNLKKHLEV
ncbi:MAG: nucleotidyl transferase AbiEii/AbiGii toxin family protein [Deltaproteobacteria bacterium]|nr:nucleotidyl transferase AbiEii/AbiGii toxin family protein [Deltaproteobacteria bacterium]